MIKASVMPSKKQKTLGAFKNYLELSSLLFDRRREEIYNVSDIPENSEFFRTAVDKAKELGINWNKMTHSQSNRVMLAILEDSYNCIREIEESDSIILILRLLIDGK